MHECRKWPASLSHPDNDGPQQEVWTEMAPRYRMRRIGDHGVHQLPSLEGWLIGEWPSDDGGLQLAQPDCNLFLYALCEITPEWLASAKNPSEVFVLHGPSLGIPPDSRDAVLRRQKRTAPSDTLHPQFSQAPIACAATLAYLCPARSRPRSAWSCDFTEHPALSVIFR
jgi:hypothetical protein